MREKITVAHCPTERMIADYFTKPLLGSLFTFLRDIIMGITPYPTKERVGDKICPGAERTEIKSSTTNTEDVQADENDTVTSTTAGTTQT